MYTVVLFHCWRRVGVAEGRISVGVGLAAICLLATAFAVSDDGQCRFCPTHCQDGEGATGGPRLPHLIDSSTPRRVSRLPATSYLTEPWLHFVLALLYESINAAESYELFTHTTICLSRHVDTRRPEKARDIRHQQPNTLNPDPSPSAQRPDRRRLKCQNDRVLFSRRLSPKSVLPARPPTTHGDLRSEVDLASQTHDVQVVRVTPRRYSSEEDTLNGKYHPRHASRVPCTRNAPLLET
jgi:hypothetical protein